MNSFSKWREVALQRSYAAPASLAAVSVPGGSGFRTLLPHKQHCPPYPASRRLTMNSENQCPADVTSTNRAQQIGPRPNRCVSLKIQTHVSSLAEESRAKNDNVFSLWQ